MTRYFVPALAAVLGLGGAALAQDQPLKINDKQYFEKRGLERARLHERVQRLVLRREDGRHRAHPPRGPHRHRRRRAPEPHARAVGPDPEARGSQGRRGSEHDRGDAALRGVRLRFAPRGHARGCRLPDRGVRSTSRCRPSSRAAPASTSSSGPRSTSSTPTSWTAGRASSRATRPVRARRCRPRRRSASSRATRRSTTAATRTTSRRCRSPPGRRS